MPCRGVDHDKQATGRGRDSIRLESKDLYTTGLFLLDLQHMPYGCGTWPAFWTFGANWPYQGEIDIIENVHNATVNQQTLHTNENCNMATEPTSLFSGSWIDGNTNCNVFETGNAGCSIVSDQTNTYGKSFNDVQGGLYAMEWTSDFIRVFSFPRASIPANALSSSPNPNDPSWGKPVGYWTLNDASCSSDHFKEHTVTFDITFCGDWAGATFSSACPVEAAANGGSCNQYVQNNPQAFEDTYWLINSLKVFKQQ